MFSQDWFERLAQSNFEKNIFPVFASRPIQYLEIGCFEGNSISYMFKNVLTHPDAHAPPLLTLLRRATLTQLH